MTVERCLPFETRTSGGEKKFVYLQVRVCERERDGQERKIRQESVLVFLMLANHSKWMVKATCLIRRAE